MELHTDPRSPIMRGLYLIDPTDVDLRHAQKRAVGVKALPASNRAARRRLARHVRRMRRR